MTTTNGSGSGEPTTTTTTADSETTTSGEQKARRKLSLTDKLLDMRDSHVKALRQLREREARISLDLERLRGDRQRREDELRRLNTTLPTEHRIAPEAIATDGGEQVEAERAAAPWHGDQPLGQAQ